MVIRQQLANKGNYGGSRPSSSIKYIVVHYTGNDGDTAANNANYYAKNVVKTSAHYFIDANEVVQSVPDLNIAWAVGGNRYSSCPSTGGGKMHGKCTNSNSISIELCDAAKNGVYAPAEATILSALSLVRELMKKYGIPQENVIRHFDVTGKLCPAYWVDDAIWKSEFWSKIQIIPNYADILKERAFLSDSTIDYLKAYKYGSDLIRKLATMK